MRAVVNLQALVYTVVHISKTIKPVDLGDLATLVVSAEKRYSMRISGVEQSRCVLGLQQKQERNGQDAVMSSVYIIALPASIRGAVPGKCS